jgi:transposase
MSKNITYIGIDAHQDSLTLAILHGGRRTAEVVKLGGDDAGLRRTMRKLLERGAKEIRACYEAGPTGFYLQRRLAELDVDCRVIAPSLIPAKPGERIKTDRRDAVKLVELLRADMLTEVRAPTEAEEAVRDLCRARADAKEDATAAKHRLTKFLARRGLRCSSRAWTIAWWKWVRALKFESKADRFVLENYIEAVEQAEERAAALASKLEEIAACEPYATPVGRLRVFRGIDTVTAMTIVSELHGFERFHHPRQLMAYLGLVPSEHSSGKKTQRGGITRAGNAHVRKALIESAWHYRHRPAVGWKLKRRRPGQSPSAIALADKAMKRLHKRWTSLVYRGKPTPKATTAVARELVGFIWATLTEARAN